MTIYFPYGEKEIEHLKRADAQLAAVIDRAGMVKRAVMPDLFAALVHSIVGQQISTKAHATVWERMQKGLGEVTPARIDALPAAELQQFGITFRKAAYIQSAARKIVRNEFDIHVLSSLPDEAVCAKLCDLDGIGPWTAEMLMLFSMQRPNILSYGDLAIRRGLKRLYGHEHLDKAQFDIYRKRYTPYASVAGLYVWAVAGGAVEGMKEDDTTE
jgi:DNA-3-methyladenine glycosylase II